MMIAKNVQRMVAPEQMARLTAWNQRKPVIAIMGEFSAGKSTLLNMLIGQAILPTQVTATKLPPVWLRHGTGAPYRVDRNNQRHPVDLHDLASVPVRDTRYIRIFCEAEVLESCDLLDTPGISDPNIPMTLWIRTIGYANAVLWCTHAGQAWRESERAAWESLPERLRHHSLLLVTRADKIVTDVDRMKIDTRLRRETEALFGGRLFISLTNAMRAVHEDGGADLWTSSGAEAFVDMLGSSINAINDHRAAALGRYRIDPASAPRVVPRRVRPHTSLADAPEGAAHADEAVAPLAAAEPAGGAASVVQIRPMRVIPAATNQRERLSAEDSQRLRDALIAGDAPAEDPIWGEGGEDETASAGEITFDDPAPAEADEAVAWDEGADAVAIGDDLAPAADQTAWDDGADAAMADGLPADATDADAFAADTDAPAASDPEADALAAGDTIEAVLFGLSDETPAVPAVQPPPHVAAGGALTASALWSGILAGREVTSVQDLLGAVTDLVAALDAHGFVAGPARPAPVVAEVPEIEAGAALFLAGIETLSMLSDDDAEAVPAKDASDAEAHLSFAADALAETAGVAAGPDADAPAAEAGVATVETDAWSAAAEGDATTAAVDATAEAPEGTQLLSAADAGAEALAAEVEARVATMDEVAAGTEAEIAAEDGVAAAAEVVALCEVAADEPVAGVETPLVAADGVAAAESPEEQFAEPSGEPAVEAPEEAPAGAPAAFVRPAWRRLA